MRFDIWFLSFGRGSVPVVNLGAANECDRGARVRGARRVARYRPVLGEKYFAMSRAKRLSNITIRMSTSAAAQAPVPDAG